MADIMEILGEDRFRVNTYRRVARIIGDLAGDVEDLLADGTLADTPGVGKSSLAKIEEFVKTGSITAHQELLQKIPVSLLELLRIPGMGPKGVKAVYEGLNVRNVGDLKAAIVDGSLADLPGFGEKKVASLAKGLEFLEGSLGRIRLDQAMTAADLAADLLRQQPGVGQVVVAGSLRRWSEMVGDVDLLVTLKKGRTDQQGEEVLQSFSEAPFVSRTLALGPTKASALIDAGGTSVQTDVRVVRPESFGAALQYFTGSKQHNVRLREIAIKQGYKLNEYGLFKVGPSGEERVAGAKEEEIYAKLGLDYVDPRLREDRGEVAAALDHTLPDLIHIEDIRGDFHMHTQASDGVATLEDMISRAVELGYQYICITDHSQASVIANGLDTRRMAKHIEQIRRIGRGLQGITLLAGSEVDILADGRMDYDDGLLAEMDFVIASIHSGLAGDRNKVTMRTLKAMDNPYVTCIGHPTGRLLGQRDAMDLDMAAVISHAAQTHTALEINSHPYRLDLKDVHCRMAVEAGVKLAIDTDSHELEGLSMMAFGVATAARGWATKADVLNTLPLAQLRKWVAQKRPR
jgi:DNA polymerase (family 10)